MSRYRVPGKQAHQQNAVVPSMWGMNGQPMAAALPIALPGDPADRMAALFDAHHERLFRLARRLAPSIDDALDLVQETLKAARSPASIPRGSTSEEAWLVRVLVNIRRDQWRRTAVRTRHDKEVRHSAIVDNGQEAVLIARATVWRALDSLTPRRRAVVVMHELEGLTIPATSRGAGPSRATRRRASASTWSSTRQVPKGCARPRRATSAGPSRSLSMATWSPPRFCAHQSLRLQ